jgi:hypothetical protein
MCEEMSGVRTTMSLSRSAAASMSLNSTKSELRRKPVNLGRANKVVVRQTTYRCRRVDYSATAIVHNHLRMMSLIRCHERNGVDECNGSAESREIKTALYAGRCIV